MENQLSITLKNNILFQDIDFSKINLENIKGQLSTLSEGEILYREGAVANKIYLIVSGEVNLLKKSNIGKTKSFIFSENEYFGHDEFIDNINRVSTVVALRDTYLISLSKEEVENLLVQDDTLKSRLVSAKIEDLHTAPLQEIPSVNAELNNAFNSDITANEKDFSHQEYLDGRIDEAINEIHFEDEEKENNLSETNDSFSFSQFHNKIEQLPNDESEASQPEIEIVDNNSEETDNFSLDNLDESSINEDIPENIFEAANQPVTQLSDEVNELNPPFKPQVEGLSETPLNREIENFESPDDYEDETDDVEFTLPKIEPDETIDEIDTEDLSFLNDDPEETEEDFALPPTEEIQSEVQDEIQTDDDIFMGGISSADELRKIDELINAESSISENEEVFDTEIDNEFPPESNIVEEDRTEEITIDNNDEIDPFIGLGIDESSTEQTNLEDTVKFEDTISFDEPETPLITESESPTDDYEVSMPTTPEHEPEIGDPEVLEAFEEQQEELTAEPNADVILDPIPISQVVPESPLEEKEEEKPPVPQAARPVSIDLESDEPNLSANQLRMIIKASEMVNSNLKLDDLLDNIVDVAASLTSADRGTLYIVENEKDELWSKVATGDEVKEYHLKIGEGIAGWVAQSGEIVNIKDAQQDERFNSEYDKASGYNTKSMLCFPVKNKEGIIIGVIQLLNSRNDEFSQLDEEMLNAVSIQIALALEKATLLEQLLQGERVSSLGKMANFLIQDIKKPILVSKRYADHLREKDLKPEIKQVLEMMTDQLNHVADIVQTTSSYSQGNVVLRTVETKIDTLLDDFINRIDSYVRTKNCQIVKEFETDATVKIDAKEFYQCFNHVIKNACDAMPDGGNIKLSTKLEGKQVVLSFSDTGLGIPEGLKDKVFEPFMSHGKREGTGLGLSITKKVVEHHGGSIEIESFIGTGTTIIIKLPVLSAY